MKTLLPLCSIWLEQYSMLTLIQWESVQGQSQSSWHSRRILSSPPIDILSLQIHIEQLSPKLTWRLAEQLNYKKKSHIKKRKRGRNIVCSGLILPAWWSKVRNITGTEALPEEQGIQIPHWASPDLGTCTEKTNLYNIWLGKQQGLTLGALKISGA